MVATEACFVCDLEKITVDGWADGVSIDSVRVSSARHTSTAICLSSHCIVK